MNALRRNPIVTRKEMPRMNNQPTIRSAMLVGALVVVAATAWATTESNTIAPAMPATAPSEPVPTVDVTAHEIAPPSDATAAPATASEPAPAPAVAKEKIAAPKEKVAEPTEPQPPITVEERRLTEDERIQAEVMDKLANDPRLSGKIAVETRDAEVWLSGHTGTAGQAWNAGRVAGKVKGVRYVHNEIRPWVGHL
ncbi:MAG TPA: BON domain-containing protein [Usitatibacter sp.]|nr:BON domain-containing protein [Usitatibacter sp.]